MPTSRIYKTVDEPIPSWMGPAEAGIPDILIKYEDAPTISAGPDNRPPFHCAETVDRDGGVIDSTKVDGTIFDDQT